MEINRNKKSLVFSVICMLFASALIWGCASATDGKTEDNEAYINETDDEMDDAVNTAKVGISYKEAQEETSSVNNYSPEMEKLKQGVVTIIGENYWPDEVVESEDFYKVTCISQNMYEDFNGRSYSQRKQP